MTLKASSGITLRQIRAFLAVASEGSFTRAAEAQLLTQPALTNCIRQLEEHVGHPLFERTTRRVALNAYGRALVEPAERMLRELERGLETIRAIADGDAGEVTVGTVPSIASSILPRAIAEFSQLNPRIGITVAEDHTEGVRRKIQEGEVEFGLTGFTEESFQGVEEALLFYDQVGLFCRAAHPLARMGRPLRWADLGGHEIFNMGYRSQVQSILDVAPELASSLSQTSYKVRNTLTVLSLIRSRDAVAALPRLSIPEEALTDLVFRPLTKPDLRRDVFLCRRAGHDLSAAARRFITTVRQSAADAGAVLNEAGEYAAPPPAQGAAAVRR